MAENKQRALTSREIRNRLVFLIDEEPVDARRLSLLSVVEKWSNGATVVALNGNRVRSAARIAADRLQMKNIRAEIVRLLEREEDPERLAVLVQDILSWVEGQTLKVASSLDTVEGKLYHLRTLGWTVGVHNDYRLNNERMTFWQVTHPETGRFLKGEGKTDNEALQQIIEQEIVL